MADRYQQISDDLSQLDLAYAPPFSPAKDPVVVGGFVAENMIEEKASQMSVEELEQFMEQTNPNEYLLIDSRTVAEYERGTLRNAVNYPLNEIRNHLDYLKKQDKPIVIFCQRGLRGYLAEQILKNNNIKNVVNVAGGYKLWTMYGGEVVKPEPVFV